jgi:hypothetical protein
MDFDMAIAVSRAYTAQRRMTLIENNWMQIYTGPAAYESRYRESFYNLQSGLFGSYVNLEKKLLDIYAKTLDQIDGKKQEAP